MNVTGHRVLIVGDSLSFPGATPKEITQGSTRRSAAPGDLLGSMLLEAGASAVRVNAKVGRSAVSYLTNESALITSDLAWRPTRIVIMLGTNDTQRDFKATAAAFKELHADYKMSGAEVWAVGPMAYVGSGARLTAPALSIVDIMQKEFGPKFIDARPLSATDGRASDGIHFTATSAPPTAAAIAKALLSKRTIPTSTWIFGLAGIGLAFAAWFGTKVIARRIALR
jgi:lysophospholipase L1-like esterase